MQIQQLEQKQNQGRYLLLIILLLEWFALPAQFYSLINRGEFTFPQALVRFFSFFTVLSNSIVAICTTILFFGKQSGAYNFFRKNTTLTAITVYILIVGIVFNILLRSLKHFEGLPRIVTEIFHTIGPLLFLLYWLLYVSKNNLTWKSIPVWMIYPLIYVVYTLIHGYY